MAGQFLIRDFFLRLRLLTVKQKEPYLLFRSILGFYPHHIEVYELALRHKSSSVLNEDGILLNNERLEFLGDAVLNVLVSDILFHQFENQKEGFLTKARSRIVQRESLNRIASELKLNQLIVSAQTVDTPHLSIYGNALEALIGAIYTDQGYRRCKLFLEEKIFNQFIDIDSIVASDANYKSALLEWGQQHKANVVFQTEEQTVHGKKTSRFYTKVLLNDETIGEGYGFSKKEAHQHASLKAMDYINLLAPVSKSVPGSPSRESESVTFPES
jgi:ribonuclease-3